MPETSASAGLTTNLMSAERHGNKTKFDFEDYYNRKLSLLQKYEAKVDKIRNKNSEKWNFENYGLIALDKESNFRLNRIYDSIQASLGPELFASVEAIG